MVKKRMRVIAVYMPDALVQGLEELVRRGFYPSKSAAVRFAVKDLLRQELG